MSIDCVGDFLTIIRNAARVSKLSVLIAHSNMRFAIAMLLKREGFVKEVTVEEIGNNKKVIKITLKYVDGESVIHEIKRISTPGCRVYSSIQNVKPVIGGIGVSILTTSHGVLTHKQAKKLNAGGELICTIW
ncbi:MAG TPA: 30S ribosomal protein S8 [Patescibacteria group bacterium]|jgi:small subunit ribosomal protein S8|nr:30S ribosomal protein S8 [Patescibacteria group bacterium]